MPKPNKENIITEILVELERGVSKKDCLANVGEKWRIASRTFDRYWKTANERHAVNQESMQKAISEEYIQSGKERVKMAILTKEQRMEILTSIAKGEIPLTKPMIVDGVIQEVPVVPNWMDRKSAIAELNKMDGSYAPIKTENANFDMLSPEDRERRILALKNKIKDL